MEFNWQTKDGISIFGKEWRIEDPKAVIALVHGFGEHCMRYDSMAQYYNNKGYAVVAYDRRGHGQSSGALGYTPNYEAFLEEMDDLIKACKERYPEKPIVIYGHSMGGNLVLNYMIARNDPAIKVTVVTGPWIRLVQEPPGLLKAILRFIRMIYPRYSQGKKIGTLVSRVQEEVEKYNNDPLTHGKISAALACEMFKWADFLLNYKGSVRVPTLVQHGGDDRITSLEATKTFVENASGPITFKIWDELYHEIHNESIREQVYDYTIDWLDQQSFAR